jgi:hypothetical protein
MSFIAPTDKTTGTVVTAAHWNQDVVENVNALFPDGYTTDVWSPGLKGTTADATPTVTGRQYQVGGMLHLWVNFVIGVDGGSGTYFVELPQSAVGLASSVSEGSGQPVGAWMLRDDSVPRSYNGVVQLRTADQIHFNVGPGSVSNVFPMQIQPDDELSFYAVIPVA